jgi:hypothetical protein
MALFDLLWLAQQVRISAPAWPLCCRSRSCFLLKAHNSKQNDCLCNLNQSNNLAMCCVRFTGVYGSCHVHCRNWSLDSFFSTSKTPFGHP